MRKFVVGFSLAATFLMISCRQRPSSAPQEAILRGFSYDKISFKVLTADDQPLAGIPLAWNMSVWSLSAEEVGQSQNPVQPLVDWQRRIIGGEAFGETKADGTFTKGRMRATAPLLNRPAAFMIFATAVSRVKCPTGDKSIYVEVGALESVAKDPKGDGQPEHCTIELAHERDIWPKLDLTCKAEMTSEALQALIKERQTEQCP